MLPRIVEARHVSDFTIWLRFSDGAEGEVNLRPHLSGAIFEPLQRVETFRRFRLDPELKTLVWPNGADFAPEFLREKLQAAA